MFEAEQADKAVNGRPHFFGPAAVYFNLEGVRQVADTALSQQSDPQNQSWLIG